MQIKTFNDNGKARFVLSGSFTFDAYRDFKTEYTPILDSGTFKEMEIDLGGVEYLDSSALGMLLLLKERVGSKPITLSNAKGTVKSVLEIANFHQLFTMK